MDTLRQDLRFALRTILRDRAFAATTILTLALCIGANAAIFAIVRSVLLEPLPYPDAGRLVLGYDSFPGAGVERAGTSVPNYFDRLSEVVEFDAQALYRFRGRNVGEAGTAEWVTVLEVTPSFFRVLRARPDRGRLFTEREGEIGNEHVAILAHGYAQRVYGSTDRAVGRDLRLNGERYAVIGVVPPDFAFLDPEVRMFLPLTFSKEERSEDSRHSQNHDYLARLAPGATLIAAKQRIDAMNAHVIERAGPLKPLLINAGYHTRLVPLEADVVRNVRGILYLLWGGALFVLLIAAVNITNLVLVRATGRLKELATRHALGAGHARLGRQLLTETTLLTLAGGLIGLLLGTLSLRSLTWLRLDDLPRAHEIGVDWVVVAFIVGVALVLGVLVGTVPLTQLAGLKLNVVLREDARTGTPGRGARMARRTLVSAQMALAFVLLVGAGLLLASFRHLLAVNPGFTAEHVLTARVNPPEARYKDNAALNALTNRVLERIRALPGVEATGATSSLPFSGDTSSSVILAEGYVMQPGESVVSPTQSRATPGYFEALGIPLKRGRFFTESDTASAPRVVIVDERLARRFWPGSDPVGRRMFMPQSPEDLIKPGPGALWLQVVGVVGTVKLQGLVETAEDARVGAYYFPNAQDPTRYPGFAVRTSGDPVKATKALRQALAGIDPELALFDVVAMPERVERSLDRRRTPMLLSLAFGGVALLLAAIGIYGVLAYQVTQRTREIGIRMALGSDAAGVVRLVLREGLLLVAIGLLVGATGAVALRQAISSQLYGVRPLDPVVLLTVAVVLSAAALVACAGPARRASRVDPVVALADQ